MAAIDTPADVVDASGTELDDKIALLRDTVARNGLGGIRLRGQDWFAWATCGGSSAVPLASEHGVAEVLATSDGVQVLTSAIEADRVSAEEVPAGLPVLEFPWASPEEGERLVREATGGQTVASDVPTPGEVDLPAELVREKRRLRPQEITRYRQVGRGTAEAITESLEGITPASTEFEVAGLGAEAMLRRGIEPALVLVAGTRRMDLYRHPRPTGEAIGDRVMVVLCGRSHGLYANLTRVVSFRQPTAAERAAADVVAQVEAAALGASTTGQTLDRVFAAITDAYARLGHPGAEGRHHQGGTTGYLSREALAAPGSAVRILPPVAMAWNPSLPGMKIEDTILRTDDGLEVLTADPAWPTVEVAGRPRPAVSVRT
jgi:hypothetical protein